MVASHFPGFDAVSALFNNAYSIRINQNEKKIATLHLKSLLWAGEVGGLLASMMKSQLVPIPVSSIQKNNCKIFDISWNKNRQADGATTYR